MEEESKYVRDGGKGSRKPYKFIELKRKEYLELISKGIGRHEAARIVGVLPETVCHYAKTDPEWKVLVHQAEMRHEEELTDRVENALHKKACEGNPSSMFFWLQNRRPEKWQDKRAPKVVVEKTEAPTPEQIKEQLEAMLNVKKDEHHE